MARAGIRARKKRRTQMILAVIATTLTIVAVSAVAWLLYSREKPVDSATLCPASGPRGHFVLLVDKTDPLTFLQKESFTVIVRELVDRRIPEGYLLSVFALDQDFQSTARPLIELCNPGDGQSKSELTNNLQRLRAQYAEQFADPIKREIDALVASKPATQSPILEMFQLVSLNAFRKHDVKGERRLIVMSDMLHNNGSYSMYRSDLDFASFAASEYGRRMHAALPGVQVELHYLMNTPKFQTRRQLKFWEDYFESAGARMVSVAPL